jgi:ferredoxin
MSPIIDLDAKRPHDFAMAEDYDYLPRVDPLTISLDDRKNWKEVERVYTEQQARQEGNRCLRCNFNTIFSSQTCILCGGCIDVCPEQCLSIIDVNQIARGSAGSDMDLLLSKRYEGEEIPHGAAIIKDDTRCVRCDLCVRRCPTDAITMERFEEKEIALNV